MDPPSSSLPLVSVIIPAYNHEAYVEEAVRSVLAQTYPNVELIVVDDCSSDGTTKVAERLARENGFTFLRNETNQGINRTIDVALESSNGDYVSVLASDDLILPSKIDDQVKILASENLDAVYGTCVSRTQGEPDQVIDLSALTDRFSDNSVLDHIYTDSSHAPLLQSALIRKECFLALSAERKKFKSDDWVMLVRLLERYRVKFVNKPWFIYRQHGSNTYRDYWATLPQRVEVLSLVTPEPLRTRGLANMFRDQAQFLYMDKKYGQSLKFLVAAMAMRPSPRWSMPLLADLAKRVVRQGWRRLTGTR